jgi:hypothetical protein
MARTILASKSCWGAAPLLQSRYAWACTIQSKTLSWKFGTSSLLVKEWPHADKHMPVGRKMVVGSSEPCPLPGLCMHCLASPVTSSFHQTLVQGSDVVLPKINAVLNFFNSIFSNSRLCCTITYVMHEQ